MKVVVLNGWAADASTWDDCGFSRERIFSYLDHLNGTTMKAIESEEAVVLVAFSMGSMFALEAVLRYPEKIKGLVLVSATPRMMEALPDWPGLSPRRKEALRLGTLMARASSKESELFREENLDRGLDFLGSSDVRSRLEMIAGQTRFPVAIFHSRKDGIVRPAHAEFLWRIFPQASFTWVEGNEHDLPRKIPAALDRAVAGIVRASQHLARGLIEVSNRCHKNCSYCGIRSARHELVRYHLTVQEVLECAAEAVRRGYPGIALQAGELESEENTRFYEDVLAGLDRLSGARRLEVTLSLGEQAEEVYRRWKTAAGNRMLRYLLRIETSNRELYAKLHPSDHSYDRRLECIRTLKRIGFFTGSGVMIGLSGQTDGDLERDLEFFEYEHLDMVGMGPYLEEPGTPLAETSARLCAAENPDWWSRERRLEKTLWMIRETRRRLPQVNIVASTALEVLAPGGRELGFANGANVYMPNLTPECYRANYELYPGKTQI